MINKIIFLFYIYIEENNNIKENQETIEYNLFG